MSLKSAKDPVIIGCTAKAASATDFLDRHAFLKNGDITARLFVQEWGNALQISFYNEKEELLLREVSNGAALARKARKYVWKKCKKNYADLGIRTFWLDEAELDTIPVFLRNGAQEYLLSYFTEQ